MIISLSLSPADQFRIATKPKGYEKVLSKASPHQIRSKKGKTKHELAAPAAPTVSAAQKGTQQDLINKLNKVILPCFISP